MPVRKKITANLGVLTLLFCLPLVAMKWKNSEKSRLPASTVEGHKHEHAKLHQRNSSPLKLATKNNSSFGSFVTQEVLEHDASTGLSRIKVNLEFESFSTSNDVVVSWKLPENVSLESGDQEQTFDPMAAGDRNKTSIIIRGDVFKAGPCFVEIYSVINDVKLGSVQVVKLQKSVESHLEGKSLSESSGPKSLSKQLEVESEYKIIY